jgi:hypothetical protein
MTTSAADPMGAGVLRQAAGAGGVASGSGGEAPDPGSPRGEGNKRARTSTSTSPGDAGCPPRPLITARHASRTAVVSSPELLEHVLTFLAGCNREARRDVGRAALVCRSWRDAAVGKEVWGRVASEVMPAMERRVLEVGARRCVMEHGHLPPRPEDVGGGHVVVYPPAACGGVGHARQARRA